MIDFQTFCDSLKLDTSFRLYLAPHWDELACDWQNETLPFFLSEDYFRKIYPLCKGPFSLDEILPSVRQVIALAKERPEVALLAHCCHKGAFVLKSPIFFHSFLDKNPPLEEENQGILNLMVSLGVYPQIRRAYATIGVPEKYARDAMQWFGGSMLQYKTGYHGLAGRIAELQWPSLWVQKKLFRIGRLEYKVQKAEDWLPLIFRNNQGKLAVLCQDGWRFREDGYRAEDSEEAVFTTTLEETPEEITGYFVPPNGIPQTTQKTTLKKQEWHPLLSCWDLAPTLHIPGGEPLPFEAVKDSLLQAKEFFPKYLHRTPVLFSLSSWVLNPVWGELLEHSNMVRLRREMYDIPSPAWGKKAGMRFVFGIDDRYPYELPATNTMQRVMQEASRLGKMGAGAGFVLAEDIEKLGSEFYQPKTISNKTEARGKGNKH